MQEIKEQDWKWFGAAGHFICSDWCRFHMATLVGNYIVSTVGEYIPDSDVREILASCRGKPLEGHGDARRSDWLKKFGFEEIGCDRTYETMVFLAGKPCTVRGCDCGLPEISGTELDFAGYKSPREATHGHMEMCRRWSAPKNQAA